MNSGTILVIGYGNSLRGDDGAGRRVAEAIARQQWRGVRTLSVQQLTPELAADISQARGVIFIDAVPSEAAEIAVTSLQGAGGAESFSHLANPRSLLALSQVVYGAAPRAWQVLIPGSNFAFGENLSPMTERLVADALKAVERLIEGAGEEFDITKS